MEKAPPTEQPPQQPAAAQAPKPAPTPAAAEKPIAPPAKAAPLGQPDWLAPPSAQAQRDQANVNQLLNQARSTALNADNGAVNLTNSLNIISQSEAALALAESQGINLEKITAFRDALRRALKDLNS